MVRKIAFPLRSSVKVFFERIQERAVKKEVAFKKARMCNTILESQIIKDDPHLALTDRYDTYLKEYNKCIFAPPETPPEGNRLGKIFNNFVDEKERVKMRDKISTAFIKKGLGVHGGEATDRAKELEQFCVDWTLNMGDYLLMLNYIVENANKTCKQGIFEVIADEEVPNISFENDERETGDGE